ncbi:MAG: SMC family ATPase [Candidatus Micrarchaeota archaeon]
MGALNLYYTEDKNIGMIKSLVLENWRSHGHSEFIFSKGTNVLVGNMGSGKTSSMDAICFALFGTFPALQTKKLKLDQIVRNKPEQTDRASVSLKFDINGEEYEVIRRIKLGKGTCESTLLCGGKVVESPDTKRVTEAVCSALKINYDLFSRAVYAEQNNIDYFLEIPKGKRKQKIDELLQIDKFENARRNLGALVNKLGERKDSQLKFVEENRGLADAEPVKKELLVLQMQADSTEKELAVKRSELEKAKSKYVQLSQLKKQYEQLRQSASEANGKISFINSKISKLEKPAAGEADARASLSQLKKMRDELKQKSELKQNLEKKLAELDSLISHNERHIGELEQKFAQTFVGTDLRQMEKSLKQETEGLQKQLNEKQGVKAALEMQKQENEAQIHSLDAFDKCPTCETKLTPEKRNEIAVLRRAKTTEIDRETGKISGLLSMISEQRRNTEKKIENIQVEIKKVDEFEFGKGQKERMEKEILSFSSERQIIRNRLAGISIAGSLDEVDNSLKKAEKACEYYDSAAELQKISALAAEYAGQMAQMNYSESEENAVFALVKETEKQIAVIAEKMQNMTFLAVEKKKRLDEIEKIGAEVERSRADAENLTKHVESFNVLSNVLQSVQSQLRLEFTETTNAVLSDVWDKMYPYGDYVDLQLAIDETGDYILQLKTRGEKWANVEGVTSGGERSTACLALRIALSLALTQNLSWLVLDEPTHNLDQNAIQELAVVMREHLPEIVDQVFIITHEPALEKAASGSLFRLEREKAEDAPTQVIREEAAG